VNKETICIEIDVSPWLDSEGNIETDLFIGDSCESVCSKKTSLIDLIDRELESFTIYNKIDERHYKDVESLVNNLKKAYNHATTRAKELGYDDA
jgi:hypothetical protein